MQINFTQVQLVCKLENLAQNLRVISLNNQRNQCKNQYG